MMMDLTTFTRRAAESKCPVAPVKTAGDFEDKRGPCWMRTANSSWLNPATANVNTPVFDTAPARVAAASGVF